MSTLRTRFALICVVASLVLGGMPSAAHASPNASVSAANAALKRAVREYDAASERLSAIEAFVDAQTAELDSVITQEAALQESLGERARYLYRSGPLNYVEILLGSRSLADFLTRLDALVRIGLDDARTIVRLETTRKQLSAAASLLLERQTIASRELRALEAARSSARKALASSQAAYASYLRQIAAREAAAREASSRKAAAAKIAGASAPATTLGQPAATASGSRDSAPWRAAVASCYGSGSYGIHLASGFTIGPDSMIVAHKTLPFGTLVEFSYRGHTAIATVADRGPYVPGRTWDLGPGTARVLGFDGVASVRYRVIQR